MDVVQLAVLCCVLLCKNAILGTATTGAEMPTRNNSNAVDITEYVSQMDELSSVNTEIMPEAITAQDPCLSLCSCDIVAKRVDCSARGLTNIPAGLSSDLHYLDLSYNNLSQLTDINFENFPDIQEFDLSFNHLSNLSAAIFTHNHYLKIIHLQYNSLGDSFLSCSHLDTEPVVNTTKTNLDNDTSPSQCNITKLHMLDLSGNGITILPVGFLDEFSELEVLVLDHNQLSELPEQLALKSHPLQHLSVNNNNIQTLNCASLGDLCQLLTINFGYNQLTSVPDEMCSAHLPRLVTLTLSGNLFNAISTRTFKNSTSLTVLSLSHLQNLRYLTKYTFAGLPHLQVLDLSHNPNLQFIHSKAFIMLYSLEVLDLSHCSLTWLHEDVVQNLSSVVVIRFDDNPWHCDCDLKWLPSWLQQRPSQMPNRQHGIICTSPPNLAGQYLNTNVSAILECQGPVIVNNNITLWFRIGAQAVLDCVTEGYAKTKVIWKTPKKLVLEYHPGYHNFYDTDPNRIGYHDGHVWHQDTAYYALTYQDRITVLYNGSLYIDYITRKDAGNYTCMVETQNFNETVIIPLRIDSSIFQYVKIYSMIWGFICAFTFLFITMVASTIHYYAVMFSSKERRKRKSIREVLNSLHDFKTVQIDRLCAYKTTKLNKLSAFKEAKIHKLVAFKTAKVGKLRNYKQVTMASIFHHLEKMREHYNNQMNRVKDNCTQQAEKLRENYTYQVIKIKDYKSEKLDRIRDNYNSQVVKIKEVRCYQMDKLRDQYKLQQQYLLKLMELLDIGNCLHVVEAECMRTESMIFDPNISFDLEAEPVYIRRDMDLSDVESEYMTAGSQSDLSMNDNTLTTQASAGPIHRMEMGSESCNYTHYPHDPQKLKNISRMKHRSHNQKIDHQRQGSTSSDSSSDMPIQHHVIVTREPPPPPPFSCTIPHIEEIPLEQLVADTEAIQRCADVDAESLSIYETPGNSNHEDIECATACNIPHDVSPSRDSNTNSISTVYESVAESREPSLESDSNNHLNWNNKLDGSDHGEKQQPTGNETIL